MASITSTSAAAVTARHVRTNIRNTATCRTRRPSRISRWRKQYVVADRMFTSHFDGSSFISHQYIIAGQASSAVNYPLRKWGCDGGPSDTVKRSRSNANTVRSIPACFDNQTIGDELDHAGVSWRFYTSTRQRRRRNLERLSGDQAHPLRPGLDQRRHHPAVADSSRRCERQLAGRQLGNADLRELRSRRLRLQHRSGVGDVGRERDRRKPVLELDRDLRDVGRLRRLVRSRSAAAGRLRRTGHPRAPR